MRIRQIPIMTGSALAPGVILTAVEDNADYF